MSKHLAKGRIRKAKTEDVECIHEWLQKQEQEAVHGTFLCNWNLTLESAQSGELIVFVESTSSKAVAYQWGALTRPGILEVRADMRGRGIGKRLVEYRIKQAKRKKICILWISCKPLTSIPFWRKMGFELFNNDKNYAYRLLEQQLSIPQEGEKIDIGIKLYPNSRQWDKSTPPSKELFQKGTLVNSRIVYLSERVCIPDFRELWDGDVVIEILLNGNTLYVDKAKYDAARRLGVQYQRNGFSIERLNLNNSSA